MEFELFDQIAPIAGETQIRTDGLRISSYTTDVDGVPVMGASSHGLLYPTLLAKAAFDRRRRSINEPVPEPARPAPIVIFRAPVVPVAASLEIAGQQRPAPVSERKTAQAVSGDDAESEDHASRQENPHEPVGPASVDEPSLRSVRTLDSAPSTAATRQVIDEGSEEIVDGLSGDAIDTHRDFDPELGQCNFNDLETGENDEVAPCVVEVVPEPNVAPEPDSRVSVSRRRILVLTPEERAVGLKYGVLRESSPSTRTAQTTIHSVLDGYEPIHKERRQPRAVPRALLVRRICQQSECCIYCGHHFGSFVAADGRVERLQPTVEHISPRAKKLNNHSDNIAAACQICQRLKSSRVFDSIEQARDILQAAWKERGYDIDDTATLKFIQSEIEKLRQVEQQLIARCHSDGGYGEGPQVFDQDSRTHESEVRGVPILEAC